jgi:6-phosphogluconolactonase (cycloisomerase 2 family)
MRPRIIAGIVAAIWVCCSGLAAQTTPPIYLFSLEDKGVPVGTVHSYSVNQLSGGLTEAPGSPFNAGLSPNQIAVDPSGRFVYVLNSESEDITGFSVDASTGTLSTLPGSPFPIGSPPLSLQPTTFAIDPTGRFLYVSAGTDSVGAVQTYNILEYTIDGATGVLAPAAGSPVVQGTLATSISFSPSGNYAYMAQTGTIGSGQPFLVYSMNFVTGNLTEVGAVQPGATAGQSIVDPSGRFLYWIDPLATKVAAFTINSENGSGTQIPGSPYPITAMPWRLAINPAGSALYVAERDGISAFQIDPRTGGLAPVSGSPFDPGTNPLFFVLDPSGKFGYATATTSAAGGVTFAQILGYSVNPTSGALTPFSSAAWTDSAQFSGGYRLAIAYASPATSNPVPMIASISPSTANGGGPAFTLQVNGANFVSGATVYFGGQGRNTTFVNSTQLTASIPASDISNSGTAAVFVFNPLPGGGPSSSVEFTVLNPTPAVASISPSSVVASGAGFTLTVNGSGFDAGSTVSINGTAFSTTYVNSTQLTINVPGTISAFQGSYSVTVINEVNGAVSGGTSNAVTLTITPAVVQPTVSAFFPPSVTAGGPAFTLTVNGNGFVAGPQGSQISFALAPVPTTFVSTTQLTAVIPASAIAVAGDPYVIVTNPGGQVSTLVTFTVNNPQPTKGGISPSSLPAGSNALTLNVSGSQFVSGSTVLVNGNPRPTLYVSSSLLQATLLASDLTQGGTLNISVMTPPPGGGTTAATVFAVTDYSVSASLPTVSIVAGAPLSVGLTVSPTNGTFSAPVTFSIAGLPTGATASFSPSATITPGPSSTQITLSIVTTPHSTAFVPVQPSGGPQVWPISLQWLFALGVLCAACGIRAGIRLGARLSDRAWLLPPSALATLLLLAASLTACNSGAGLGSAAGASSTTPPVSTPTIDPTTGTPAGTYTIVVTATSGTVSHSTNVTLNVS